MSRHTSSLKAQAALLARQGLDIRTIASTLAREHPGHWTPTQRTLRSWRSQDPDAWTHVPDPLPDQPPPLAAIDTRFQDLYAYRSRIRTLLASTHTLTTAELQEIHVLQREADRLEDLVDLSRVVDTANSLLDHIAHHAPHLYPQLVKALISAHAAWRDTYAANATKHLGLVPQSTPTHAPPPQLDGPPTHRKQLPGATH